MAFGSFLYDARATWAGRRLYRRQWARNAYWSADKRREFQYRHLRALLIDAAVHVPYYRRMFAEIGFVPAVDFTSTDVLKQLPVLSKHTVRTQGDRLRRRPLPGRSVCERTSGSSGEPLSVWISASQIAVEKATVWRHWRWNGYRFRDPVAIVRTYVPRQGQDLWRYDRWRNFLYFSAYHLDDANAVDVLIRIRRFRPQFLRGYPASLAILADAAVRTGYQPPPIQAILTASETLTPDVRDKLTSVFQAPVSDWYGLAEQVVTASQCPSGDGLHCHDDYGYWELIPLEDGSGRCRIVGTNLHNTAMPLIRYDTGDLTVGSGRRACSCGRTFPTIAGIAGRCDDDLVGPDGRRIPSVNFYSVFRDYSHIRRFQMIQETRDLVEVRLDTDTWADGDQNRLLRELRRRLGEGMAIRITRTDVFEKNPHGKRRVVISRVAGTREVNP